MMWRRLIFGAGTSYFDAMGIYTSVFQTEIQTIGKSIEFNSEYRYGDILLQSSSHKSPELRYLLKMLQEYLAKLNELGRSNTVWEFRNWRESKLTNFQKRGLYPFRSELFGKRHHYREIQNKIKNRQIITIPWVDTLQEIFGNLNHEMPKHTQILAATCYFRWQFR